MKYLVMECHAGYAVLMDEASRFVRAANLHYEVGQTVTDPILMQEDAQPQIRMTHKGAVRIAAAAACLLLMSAAGFGYYRSSTGRTKSVVVVVEQKRYELMLNRSGEVVSVQHHSGDGQPVVEDLGGQHRTAANVVNSLLKDSLDQGQISGGDTVRIYLAAENARSYETYKSEIESEAAKLQLNAEVQGLDAAPEPPAPPAHENGTKPAPEKDAKDAQKPDPKKETPPAPAEPSAPAHGKDGQGHTPPVPPAHGEKPVPPAQNETPAAPSGETAVPAPADPPQPPAAAEPPQPVQEKEGKQEKHEEHEHPEPAAPGDQEADKPVTPPEPSHPHPRNPEAQQAEPPAAPLPAELPAPDQDAHTVNAPAADLREKPAPVPHTVPR